MIWVIAFLIFFLFNVKNFIFFSSFLVFDNFRIFMTCISPLVFFLISNFVFPRLISIEDILFNFFFFILIFLVTCTFLISDSFYFLLFLESTVCFIVTLMIIFSKDYDKFVSVFFIVLMNLVGSVPFIIFCYFFNFDPFLVLSNIFVFGSDFCYSWLMLINFSLILLSKLPVLFFHFWLTKAHVSASGASSILLASLMLKLGRFGLFKFSFVFLFLSARCLWAVLGLSLVRVLFFCLTMIRFFDVKYLIACSSVSHISLIFPCLLNYDRVGVLGAMFIIVGHGLISYMLFFLVRFIYERAHNRRLDFSKSLESVSKFLTILIFLYIFLNLGLPPFISFYRELYFCTFLFKFTFLRLRLFLLSIILAVILSIFIITKVLFGKKGIYLFSSQRGLTFFSGATFVPIIFFLPLILCFFSLSKTLLCGGKI